jgi:hypothetical protein
VSRLSEVGPLIAAAAVKRRFATAWSGDLVGRAARGEVWGWPVWWPGRPGRAPSRHPRARSQAGSSVGSGGWAGVGSGSSRALELRIRQRWSPSPGPAGGPSALGQAWPTWPSTYARQNRVTCRAGSAVRRWVLARRRSGAAGPGCPSGPTPLRTGHPRCDSGAGPPHAPTGRSEGCLPAAHVGAAQRPMGFHQVALGDLPFDPQVEAVQDAAVAGDAKPS